MTNSAFLALEDGSIYRGEPFGEERSAHGEVVFSTSMTGYQEMLTDPSFAGQIVVPTYPLIGNYGINERDVESARVQVAGFVVRQHSRRPSHALSSSTLDDYLRAQGIPGISGVDTRAVTRRLRARGVMKGMIAIGESPERALHRLRDLPDYGETDFVQRVTTPAPYVWEHGPTVEREPTGDARLRILVDDCGLKYNILRMLRARGCDVAVMPAASTAEDILAHSPDGVVMSPGPGDPELLDYAVQTTKDLAGQLPILGICLGNQMIARAFGGATYKLKFGHRGANHPVKDLDTGRVYITAQNHGFAVDADSLPAYLRVSHVNLNDDTVEGLRHAELPIMSIQYHSEASPGPLDNAYIFDRFLDLAYEGAGGGHSP